MMYDDRFPAWGAAFILRSDWRVIHPPTGIVLHDPESSSLEGLFATYRQTGLLPTVSIGRDGTVFRHVSPEEGRSFHVRAADRWRPDWLVPTQDSLGVSDVNRQCVGAEVLSGPTYRAEGEPYTEAQYQATAAWIADMRGQYGPLPVVGHGQLQLDRTDPVAWDWNRLWCACGYEQEEADAMELALLRDRVAALEQDQLRANAVKSEFEAVLRDPRHARLMRAAARREVMPLADYLIQRALA